MGEKRPITGKSKGRVASINISNFSPEEYSKLSSLASSDVPDSEFIKAVSASSSPEVGGTPTETQSGSSKFSKLRISVDSPTNKSLDKKKTNLSSLNIQELSSPSSPSTPSVLSPAITPAASPKADNKPPGKDATPEKPIIKTVTVIDENAQGEKSKTKKSKVTARRRLSFSPAIAKNFVKPLEGYFNTYEKILKEYKTKQDIKLKTNQQEAATQSTSYEIAVDGKIVLTIKKDIEAKDNDSRYLLGVAVRLGLPNDFIKDLIGAGSNPCNQYVDENGYNSFIKKIEKGPKTRSLFQDTSGSKKKVDKNLELLRILTNASKQFQESDGQEKDVDRLLEVLQFQNLIDKLEQILGVDLQEDSTEVDDDVLKDVGKQIECIKNMHFVEPQIVEDGSKLEEVNKIIEPFITKYKIIYCNYSEGGELKKIVDKRVDGLLKIIDEKTKGSAVANEEKQSQASIGDSRQNSVPLFGGGEAKDEKGSGATNLSSSITQEPDANLSDVAEETKSQVDSEQVITREEATEQPQEPAKPESQTPAVEPQPQEPEKPATGQSQESKNPVIGGSKVQALKDKLEKNKPAPIIILKEPDGAKETNTNTVVPSSSVNILNLDSKDASDDSGMQKLEPIIVDGFNIEGFLSPSEQNVADLSSRNSEESDDSKEEEEIEQIELVSDKDELEADDEKEEESGKNVVLGVGKKPGKKKVSISAEPKKYEIDYENAFDRNIKKRIQTSRKAAADLVNEEQKKELAKKRRRKTLSEAYSAGDVVDPTNNEILHDSNYVPLVYNKPSVNAGVSEKLKTDIEYPLKKYEDKFNPITLGLSGMMMGGAVGAILAAALALGPVAIPIGMAIGIAAAGISRAINVNTTLSGESIKEHNRNHPEFVKSRPLLFSSPNLMHLLGVGLLSLCAAVAATAASGGIAWPVVALATSISVLSVGALEVVSGVFEYVQHDNTVKKINKAESNDKVQKQREIAESGNYKMENVKAEELNSKDLIRMVG